MGRSDELLPQLRSKNEEVKMKSSQFFLIASALNLAVSVIGILNGDTSMYRFHLILVFLLLILAKEYDTDA